VPATNTRPVPGSTFIPIGPSPTLTVVITPPAELTEGKKVAGVATAGLAQSAGLAEVTEAAAWIVVGAVALVLAVGLVELPEFPHPTSAHALSIERQTSHTTLTNPNGE
jgi:hypothetical protein